MQEGPLRGLRTSANSSQSLPIRMVRRRTRKLTKGPVQNFAGASEPLQDLGQDLHIAPQRERSDAREVLRGLREPCQNSHRAKTRAIPGAQNAERVARAISKFAPRFNESDLTCTWPRERLAGAYGRFSQDIAHATKKGHGKCKKKPRFWASFGRGLQSIAPVTKNEPEASEVLHLPHRTHHFKNQG